MNLPSRSVVAAVLAALVLPSAAGAATGRVFLNEDGRQASTNEVRLVWHHRGVWKQTRGQLAGTPAIGSYHRDVDLGDGANCRLQVSGSAFALAAGDRPRLRGDVLAVRRPAYWNLQRFRVSSAIGNRKRQYVGRLGNAADGPTLTGIAVRRNPSYFRSPDREYTVIRIDVSSVTERRREVPQGTQPLEPTPEQRAACAARTRVEAPGYVRNALTTSRVQR
jgi:hypothetical protein